MAPPRDIFTPAVPQHNPAEANAAGDQTKPTCEANRHAYTEIMALTSWEHHLSVMAGQTASDDQGPKMRTGIAAAAGASGHLPNEQRHTLVAYHHRQLSMPKYRGVPPAPRERTAAGADTHVLGQHGGAGIPRWHRLRAPERTRFEKRRRSSPTIREHEVDGGPRQDPY